ncbi:hypothetical protein [Dongia sp.]|uniref:hypothetical protein n=1 Tax=Dongia sp. TaxID=1977262 RepID=UPI0035B2B241
MKFDTDTKATFLLHLRRHGNITRAAAAVGVSRSTVVAHKADDPVFAQEWEDAMEGLLDEAEEELRNRAIDGVEEPVFYKGEVVGFITRKSDSNLQCLLRAKRRDVFGDKQDVNLKGAVATGDLDDSQRLRLINELLSRAKERKDLVE